MNFSYYTLHIISYDLPYCNEQVSRRWQTKGCGYEAMTIAKVQYKKGATRGQYVGNLWTMNNCNRELDCEP